MADLLFKCSWCSTHLAVDGDSSGHVIECPKCHKRMSAPLPRAFFRCTNPLCQAELSAPLILVGESFDCPNCEKPMTVPMPVMAAPEASVAVEPKSTVAAGHCPGCGKPVAPASIMCLLCGVDLRTGKPKLRLKTPRPSPPSSKQPTQRHSASADAGRHEVSGKEGGHSEQMPPWHKTLLAGIDDMMLANPRKLNELFGGNVMTGAAFGQAESFLNRHTAIDETRPMGIGDDFDAHEEALDKMADKIARRISGKSRQTIVFGGIVLWKIAQRSNTEKETPDEQKYPSYCISPADYDTLYYLVYQKLATLVRQTFAASEV